MTTTLTRQLIGMLAATLAQLIAAGELSSAEAVEAHIERIEAVNPALNAVVVKRFAEARTEARAADRRRSRGEPLGPLRGQVLRSRPRACGKPSRRHSTEAGRDPRIVRLPRWWARRRPQSGSGTQRLSRAQGWSISATGVPRQCTGAACCRWTCAARFSRRWAGEGWSG
jgi:hypothetical protein